MHNTKLMTAIDKLAFSKSITAKIAAIKNIKNNPAIIVLPSRLLFIEQVQYSQSLLRSLLFVKTNIINSMTLSMAEKKSKIILVLTSTELLYSA